jgi:hypothetical protein
MNSAGHAERVPVEGHKFVAAIEQAIAHLAEFNTQNKS